MKSRARILVAAVVAVAAATVVLFVPAGAQTLLCSGVSKSQVATCDPAWAAAMSKSYWGMYAGHNCTNYVAWRLTTDGVKQPSTRLGNANTWAANAAKSGIRVDSKPAVGSVGAWPGRNHVVYVEEVGSDYVVTSEDNYPGYYPKGMYRKIRVKKGESAYPTQFIHFEAGAQRFATPGGLSSSAQTDTTMSVRWNAVSGAKRYRLQYATNAGMSGASYRSFTSAGATLTGLKPGTRYWFRVVVVDAQDVQKLSDYTATPFPSASTYALAAPTGLRATAQTAGTITLAWNALAGAPGYRVQYATNASMSGASYRPFSGAGGTLDGLEPGTQYWFRVVAVDAQNQDKLSSYTAAPYPSSSTTVLPAPTNLRSTAQGTSSLRLSWDAVAGAPGYRVQYATNAGMSGATYRPFSSTSATLDGLEAGTRYWFRVVAVDAQNEDKISEYTADPFPSASTLDVLTTPTALRSTGQTDTTMTLGWDAVKGAQRYRVQYADNAGMSGASYRSFTSASATLTDLEPATRYWFRVVVVDAQDEQKLTDYTATPYPSATTQVLPTPAGLRATGRSESTIKLAWNAVAGAPGYRVQYATNAGMSGALYLPSTGTSATLTGLKPGTQYWFRVVAVDAKNEVKLSDYTAGPYPSTTTREPGPWTPENLRSTGRTSTTLALAWDPVDGAQRYRVQYAPSASMSGASYRSFTSTSATLTGLKPGTQYWFRVVVVDAEDDVKLTDYTATPYPSASTALLPTPTGLRSTKQTAGSITLAWNAVAGAPGYRVQYATSASMSGASYRPFSGTSATVSGLKPGTRYWFRIVAVDARNQDKVSEYTATPYSATTTR